MKKTSRYIISLLLTIIYLLIIVTPLVSLGMQSKLIHFIPGECSGDCLIDGCPLERSAANACCCAQKKLNARSTLTFDSNGTFPVEEVPKEGSSCCASGSPDAHDKAGKPKTVSGNLRQEKRSSISSKPCGGGNLFALLSIETTLHLPFFYIEEVSSPAQTTLTVVPPVRLTSRYVDPPDPPPIIS